MPPARTAAARPTKGAPAESESQAAPTVSAALDDTAFKVELEVSTVSRTLLAGGFTIRRARRQPEHIEISCERRDLLGANIPYLLVVSGGDVPPMADLANIKRTAGRSGQVVVLIARTGGPDWLGWHEFLAALGGAVPTWRALGTAYESVIRTVATTELPTGMAGEPWMIFEEAVADGLEFLFGRRVRHMGGARRGQRVSDIVALTPDDRVLVVDAKASRKPYEVTWPNLRPLVEYTKAQKARQKGHLNVGGAVVVAADFKQSVSALMELNGEFFAETNVPLTFVDLDVLIDMVGRMTARPDLRNAVAWVKLFGQGGRLRHARLVRELTAADVERMVREVPIASKRR